MYQKILVPVDLYHTEQLAKALKTAAVLAAQFDCPVVYASVTASAPSALAHTPQEFAAKLERFAAGEADTHGIRGTAMPIVSPDPSVDLDGRLLDAVAESGADLVVMQSHVPTITDYIWPSNGGSIASHSDASVFIVR